MSIQVTTFGYRMRKQKITYLITYPLYDPLSTSYIKFVVVVITDLNLDKINHYYNHGVLHYVLNLLGKLKNFTMTETNRTFKDISS